MNREIKKKLDRANSQLMEWAEWTRRYEEGTIIGYPHKTSEASIAAEGSRGSPVYNSSTPVALMPNRIAEVDRIIRVIPKKLQDLARLHYMGDGTSHEKAKIFMVSRSEYYNLLSILQAWVAGAT